MDLKVELTGPVFISQITNRLILIVSEEVLMNLY